MNVRDLFPLVPSGVWPVFEDAARRDWLKFDQFEEDGPRFTLDLAGLAPSTVRVLTSLAVGLTPIAGKSEFGANVHLWAYAVSRVIAEGPKVFRPSLEQCLSLEHVSLTLPLEDYRQSYPTMVIELPAGYRRDVDRRTGGVPACPRTVVVRHWPAGLVMTGANVVDRGGDSAELIYVFGTRAADGTLEDVLSIHRNPDADESALLEAVTRVSLNLMLLLAHAGSRLVPSNPALVGKCRAKLRRGVKPELQRRELVGHVNFVVPEREVVVRDTRTDAARGGTHSSPVSHWRRGHWRAMPGHAEARGRGEAVPLVFVRPCLVTGAGGAPAAPVYTQAVS